MIQDTEKTKVIFRQFKTGNHAVIAYFPELPGNMDSATCMSYMHIGQHGAALTLPWNTSTRPAHPSNYADLKAELEILGYKLQVCHRFTRKHQETCRAALKNMEASNG